MLVQEFGLLLSGNLPAQRSSKGPVLGISQGSQCFAHGSLSQENHPRQPLEKLPSSTTRQKISTDEDRNHGAKMYTVYPLRTMGLKVSNESIKDQGTRTMALTGKNMITDLRPVS